MTSEQGLKGKLLGNIIEGLIAFKNHSDVSEMKNEKSLVEYFY